ncbi:hypothetical protein B0O80DRAFT_170391 [Mortierella sp. GBAus27b]|nr:hypothetical protein B0O80DRAFT_170391 [Mortierella sp. GBAus27b]
MPSHAVTVPVVLVLTVIACRYCLSRGCPCRPYHPHASVSSTSELFGTERYGCLILVTQSRSILCGVRELCRQRLYLWRLAALGLLLLLAPGCICPRLLPMSPLPCHSICRTYLPSHLDLPAIPCRLCPALDLPVIPSGPTCHPSEPMHEYSRISS